MRVVALLLMVFSLSACNSLPPLTEALLYRDHAKVDQITRKDPRSMHLFEPGDIYYPLYLAILPGGQNFSIESFRLMVERGAPTDRVYQHEDEGRWDSAMEVAAKHRNIPAMQFLLDRGEQPGVQPVLHILVGPSLFDRPSSADPASFNNRRQAVEWALDEGWPIDQPHPRTGLTPLMIAASRDDGPLIELLLARGANPDITASNGATALAFAAWNSSHNATKILLAKGAEIRGVRIGEEGETLLHTAARSTSKDVARILQLLLEAGANPNTPTAKRAYSPLAAAGVAGNAEAARVLIAAGADVHYQSPTGRTAMDTSAANMKPGDEHHYEFQAVVARAGGRFIKDAPKPRIAPPVATVEPKDNFAASLFGGLAASAVGFSQGMSEAAAVDLGASLARDIQNETVSTQSFAADRFQAANQGSATADVYARHLSSGTANQPTYSSPPPAASQAAAAVSAGGRAQPDSFIVSAGDGQTQILPVSKGQRAYYAGVYANTHRDPAVADFRYSLNADGSVQLLTRACSGCTHELDGQSMSADWKEVYRGVEWAPMLNEQGQPLIRSVEDMYGNRHSARVLLVMLADGRTKTLNHYMDANGLALRGPHGVPRYRQ